MINDATILRLDFGRNPERISPSILANLTKKLESVFDRNASALMNQNVKAVLLLVAPPRRGSLEFHFHVHFQVQEEIHIESLRLPEEKKGRFLTALAEYASIGAFLWALLWAPGGLVDRAAHEGATTPHKPARLQIRSEITEVFGSKSLLAADLAALQQIARRAGAERMEVQVPDEAPVLLFESRTRVDGRLIGRNAGHLAPVDLSGMIRPLSDEIIKVRYDGKPFEAFVVRRVSPERRPVCPDDSRCFLVLWNSNRKPPKITETIIVEAKPVEATVLEPLEPVPRVFEFVYGISMITGVANFE